MSDVRADFEDFIGLVSHRRGHFKLESGHHSGLWFNLDPLFENPKTTLFVDALTQALQPYAVDAVCGPEVGGAFLAELIGRNLGVDSCYTERVIASDDGALYRASYRLPREKRLQLSGKRLAIVDDVMSAGSALRGTYIELRSYSAKPVVAGALLILGTTGANFFASEEVPVVAPARANYDLWLPGECPLCVESIPLEDVALGD